jgi:tetratricopeptide (TPR) repeat protein
MLHGIHKMMKIYSIRLIILIFIIIFLPLGLFAQANRFAFGIGYPYFSLKYHPLEVKYATGDGVNVFAGRYYLNFYKSGKVKAFTGVEGGYIKFNTLDIKGSGYEGSIFIGGEYFVTDNISFAMDLSPTYIGLKSEDNDKANGFEIVANAAVYYYFSSTGRDTKSGKRMIDTDTLSESEKEALIEKYTTKATQYGDEGEYEKAISVWEKVLIIDPDNETAKEEIGRAKAMVEEVEEEEFEFE